MKKVVAVLLVLVLIVTLFGCAKNEISNSNNVNEKNEEENTTDNNTNESSENEENIEVSIYPDPNNKVEFDFFGDVTWLSWDNLDGICGQEVERLTGVSFDFVKATDGEQINLMMASGDLPDLVMTGSSVKQNKLSDSSLCYSFNELITEYAPDWEIPEIVKNINSYYSNDGNFYMLRNEFNTVDQILESSTVGPNFGQMHMRKDIYEAIGSPSMNTKEEIFDTFDLVKDKYPDMIPLVFNLRQEGAVAAQLVGLDIVMPTDENGDFCHLISDAKYYELMKTYNDLYRNGYILKENFTYSNDEQVFEHASKADAFILTHYAGNDDQMFTARVQTSNQDASFVQLPLTDHWKYTMPVSGWAGLFITKNCKDPETAIKFLRWAKEPENQFTTMMGVRGVDWDLNEDGVLTPLERYKKSVEAGTRQQDYTAVSFLVSATDYIRESMNFFANATDATKKVYQDATKRANWSNVVELCFPKSESEESIIKADLDSLHDEYLPLLGTAENDADFDSLFNEMLEIANEIGIDKVNEYLSSTYKSLSKSLSAK